MALGLHLGEFLLGEAAGKDDGSGDDKGDCHTNDSPDGVHLATLQVVGEDQEVGRTACEVVGNTHEAGEHSADGTADEHAEHGAAEAHEDTEERRLGNAAGDGGDDVTDGKGLLVGFFILRKAPKAQPQTAAIAQLVETKTKGS